MENGPLAIYESIRSKNNLWITNLDNRLTNSQKRDIPVVPEPQVQWSVLKLELKKSLEKNSSTG